MSNTRHTRATRSRVAELGHSAAELKSLETPKKGALANKRANSQKSTSKKASKATQNGTKVPVGSQNGLDEEVGTDDEEADNEDDGHDNDQLNREAVLAPSRESSVTQSDLVQSEAAREVSWTGLKTGDKAIDDDQASISDLDMHGSVSSDSGDEEVNDDDDSDEDAGNDEGAEEIDVADDDDDYGDVDNLSDTSEHSDQFERDVEAAWQQDDIDWDDEYVYQYDENRSGFLVDEQFLENFGEMGDTDWAIQFLDFDERSRNPPTTQPRVLNDAPMHDSPLVRRVDAMTMAEGNQNTDSDTSTQSTVQAAEQSPEESRIDDDGDDTEDDLPDENQLSTHLSEPSRATERRNSFTPSSSTAALPSSKTPVLCRIPIDPTRATARTIQTSTGRFIRRVTLPRSSGPDWVTIRNRRRRRARNSDGSPVSSSSSMGSDFGEQDFLLFNAINGRLFQQAHFGHVYRQSRMAPVQTPARNSFLSGPALHDFDPDAAADFVDSDGDPPVILPDVAQLVDFDAAISCRDFYPPSGRVRARSAGLLPAMEFDPISASSTQSAEADAFETFTSLQPSTPNPDVVMLDEQSSPIVKSTKSTPTSVQKKRRASNDSDILMESPTTKRKRAEV